MIGGTLLEDLEQFSGAKVKVSLREPQTEVSPFQCDEATLALASEDWELTRSLIDGWMSRCSSLYYLLQFLDDANKEHTKALYEHTEFVSRICDLRLKLDPTPLSKTFQALILCGQTQSEYRKDENKEESHPEFAKILDKQFEVFSKNFNDSQHLTVRMARILESMKSDWRTFPPLVASTRTPKKTAGLEVFCSYSHVDEELHDKLASHLSPLRREGIISNWHDRRITGGKEFEGEIDKQLNSADIVLLLVSADFINSDYCFDIELEAAMQRHEKGDCRVIPVILRACDWTSVQFKKLLALPKDGKAITSWPNIDEAFTDVVKRLRSVTTELLEAKAANENSPRHSDKRTE